MLANVIKLIFSALGFAMGQGVGNAQPAPQVPGMVAKVMDKFAGVIVAGAAIYWALGNRDEVVSLNYLELAAVVLILNIALKIDPPMDDSARTRSGEGPAP
jgi:hypothetical protein